jgi:hypothetical protein
MSLSLSSLAVPMNGCCLILIFSGRSRWAFPSGAMNRYALYPTNYQLMVKNENHVSGRANDNSCSSGSRTWKNRSPHAASRGFSG